MVTTARNAPPPVKVDAETYSVIEHTAHLLGKTKKEMLSEAVREYASSHQAELQERLRSVMVTLDGSLTSEVSVMTGFSADELEKLGGVD